MQRKIKSIHRVIRGRATGIALGLAALAGCGAASHASPITYTYSGVFSGMLGTQTFTDMQGVFTLSLADTNNVTTPDNAFFYNTQGLSTFQLGTMTPAIFLSSTFGVESEYASAGFQDTATGFAVGLYNELTPYDVLYGPSGSVTGQFLSYGPNPELTSLGNLILTGAKGDVTFTVASVATATTPEPSSLWLTATALFGAAAGLRRRRSAVR